jgi:hypothetical protein
MKETKMKEEFYLLGYNAMQSVENQPKFRWNMSHPFQGQIISQERNQREGGKKGS